MLAPRTDAILKYIISRYIEEATPVSSQAVARNAGLSVSSATVRNEMAYLEEEGYILRPHTSAGSVPSDKGYRRYVDSLSNLDLPIERQRLLSHVFLQVEKEIDEWLKLAAALLAQMSRNVAVVAVPKQSDCRFKYLELVSLQDKLALMVLILVGVKVKQKLISFDEPVSQPNLTAAANRLNEGCAGLSANSIKALKPTPSALEQHISETLLQVMQGEDQQEYETPYLDGLHLMLGQPEFSGGDHMKEIIELIESRTLLKIILPQGLRAHAVHVVIGNENRSAAIRNCSVIMTTYGIPEATGTIGVVGPTRMAYSSAIPSVNYLSRILTEMVAGLYGKKAAPSTN